MTNIERKDVLLELCFEFEREGLRPSSRAKNTESCCETEERVFELD
jgi:hypothetical protein